MLNYSKKLDRKILIPILIILAVFLLATTMQTDFAATNTIDNTTTGGISGALNSSTHGDTIELDDGVYTGNNNTNMTINKNITIQGKTKDKVIIDAQGLSRIYIIGNNLNITFINITFTNGYSSASGGAIYNNNGQTIMNFINCIFENNSVGTTGGGAIYNNGYNMTIVNSMFFNNNGQGAGAIYNYGSGINVKIINSTFLNNSVSNNGGVIINRADNMLIINSIFVNNTAQNNGGIIYNSGNWLSIVNSTFTNNSARNYGGVIYNNGPSNMNVINSEFFNNMVITGNGGAIRNVGLNTSVLNSKFFNNSANNSGAAIWNGDLDINIINSTFFNNTANESVIYNNGNATIINNNISNNNANGIFNTGNATIKDNIILDNLDNAIVNNGIIDDSNSNNNIMDYSEVELSIVDINVSFNRITIIVNAIGENGDLIVGKTINFYVNGVLVGTAVTDVDGIAEFSYNVSNYGVQNIVVSLDEFNETFAFENITDFAIRVYHAATNTTSINVAKTNTNATIIVSNATVGKSTIIRGVLVDDNGNTIAGASLNVVIGGKSYSVVTGTDGKWELHYTPSKAGNYNAKVYYSGDADYLASTGSINYTVAQEEEDTPTKVDIRLVKRNNSKAVRHGNVVYMKWLTFKNFGASGSQTINAKIIIKNLKYKLWKVYNKKLNYKFAKNNIKFKLNLKSNGLFKLKLKVYRPIKQK